MIPDSCCNRVYFSAKLPEACPLTYRGLTEILDRYGVPHSLLQGTNDIWCRDYMPVQVTPWDFVSFGYRPDYLLDTKVHKTSITDGHEAAQSNGITHLADRKDILVDGGNLVHCGMTVLMTAKVFEENPGMDTEYLCRSLKSLLGADVIFLPWDANEIYGHTDGLVRFIDEDTVLMTNYEQFDRKMAARFRKILKARVKNVEELKFDVESLSDCSWAYVNWLQTEQVLILPKFNIPEDSQAFAQIEKLMPGYRGRIEMVDATDLIRYEGCLNCASWTVHEPKEEARWEM